MCKKPCSRCVHCWRNTRRRFLAQSSKIALGTTMMGSILAACGNQNAATSVDYWEAVDDGTQRQYVLKSNVQDFMKQHPDINLQISFKPNTDIDRLVQVALPSGKGPDIFPTNGPSFILQYVNSNLVVDLDQYAQQYKWSDKILPWALEAGRIKGKLYSLPSSYETLVMFYNKTLFEKKGWKIPTNRDELEALAEEAMGQGIIPFIAGNADCRTCSEWFPTAFFNHYAGPDAVYQALTGKMSWTDPVFVEAMDLLNQYFQKGWFGGGVKQYFSNKFDSLDAAFAQGKAAMDLEGSWAFANWLNYFGEGKSDMEYDWFPIPPLRQGVPENLYVLGIGGTLAISKFSKSQAASAEYLDWLYSTPQRITKEMADINFEPLPIALKEADFPSNIDKRLERHYLTLNDATAKGNFGYTTWTFWPNKSDTFAYEGFDKMIAKDLTPAQFCAQMDQIFKQEMAQGTVPPIPKGKI